jgi:hypothetical protein
MEKFVATAIEEIRKERFEFVEHLDMRQRELINNAALEYTRVIQKVLGYMYAHLDPNIKLTQKE